MVGDDFFLQLLGSLALEELDGFHHGDNQQGQQNGDAVFGQAEGREAESICQEGDFQQQGGQNQQHRGGKGAPRKRRNNNK